MKVIGKSLKFLGCAVAVLVLLVAVALIVLTAAEYRPADTEIVLRDHEASTVLTAGSPLSVISWNCGYGALGDNADFFMDGGSSVYTADRDRVKSNLAGILSALRELSPDLLLLQEVQHLAESVILRVGGRVKTIMIFYFPAFLVQRATLLPCIFYTMRKPEDVIKSMLAGTYSTPMMVWI